MRQAVLLVIAVVLIGAAAFVYKSKTSVDTSALTVRNVGAQALCVAVGNQPTKTIRSNETASDDFVEGIMVRVWVGEKAEGFATGWRIYRIAGEVSINYDGEAITIAGDGLDYTALNNGPGANAPSQSK